MSKADIKAELEANRHTGYCKNQSYKDFLAGYKKAEKDLSLTWEDIDKIGDLFNECMSKLEKENSGYADYGVPSKVLAQEVLKAFNEQKNN